MLTPNPNGIQWIKEKVTTLKPDDLAFPSPLSRLPSPDS